MWDGAPPTKFPLLFGAGATTAIKSGEILDYATGTAVPLASDKAMSKIIAIADCEIRSGDLAGYRKAIIPRLGDVFEYSLAAASAPAVGANLYWSDSETLKVAGANVLAVVVDDSLIPLQGFNSVNPSYDAGVVLRTTGKVRLVFLNAVSYMGVIQP